MAENFIQTDLYKAAHTADIPEIRASDTAWSIGIGILSGFLRTLVAKEESLD